MVSKTKKKGNGHGKSQVMEEETRSIFHLISKRLGNALLSANAYLGAACYRDLVPVVD